MTNAEKLTEVFGNFLQDLISLDDFRKWLKQEYKHPDISEEVTYIEQKDGQMSFVNVFTIPAVDEYSFLLFSERRRALPIQLGGIANEKKD